MSLISLSRSFSNGHLSFVLFLSTVHHHIERNTSFNVSTVDFANTLTCTTKCITWPRLTYNTSQHLRISVTFQEFEFADPNEYVEIGDGTVIQEDTRLAHLTGTYLPSDVTSISNAMWIRLRVPCGNQIPDIRMTIIAVNKSGTHELNMLNST